MTLSYAQTLDGCLTPWPGQPVELSGPESKLLTHRLRAAHDAILVGIGTVLADDPRLTARLVNGPHPRPVIADSHLRTPPTARLLAENPHRPLIATLPEAGADRESALAAAGAEVIRLAADKGRVGLAGLLAALGERGIQSVMVEGGAAILTSFLADGLADWLIVTVAPVLCGGLGAVGDLPFGRWEDFPRVEIQQVERAGRDVVVWGVFAR